MSQERIETANALMMKILTAILVAIILGVLTYVGSKATSASENSAVTAVQIAAIKDTLQEIRDAQKNSVSKSEFNSANVQTQTKFASIEAENNRQNLDIVKLQYMLKLDTNKQP